MNLFRENFLGLATTPEIHQYKIKIKNIGRIDSLPIDVQDVIHQSENATKDYINLLLQIVVGFSDHIELIDAIRGIIKNKSHLNW